MSHLGGKRTLRVRTYCATLIAVRLSFVLAAFLAFTGAPLAASEAIRCVRTLPAWVSPYGKRGLQLRPNIVSIKGRELRWNGVRVHETQLSSLLRSAAKLNPLPPLVFKSDYRDCGFAHRIERVVKASYPCSDGRCSEVTSS